MTKSLLDNITLYNMDCFDFISTLNSGEIDVVFTSPPYNRKRNDKYEDYDDNIDDYYNFLCSLVDCLIEKVNKYIIVNVQTNYYNKSDVYKFIGKYSDKIQQIFVWDKTNPMPASGESITNAYEFFITIGTSMIKSNQTYTKNVITTSVNSDKNDIGHHAVMNLEVAEWFIKIFTAPSDVIYDPFMGIGTTAIACKRYGRRCIGTEISESYYRYSVERVKNFSFQKDIFD